jgi:hypothetical protein
LTCSSLRESLRTVEFDRVEAAITPHDADNTWPYRLTFLEVGDDGGLQDGCLTITPKPPNCDGAHELDRALESIAAAKADASALGTTAVVALFVHGWKNNASDDSGNVWGFRQVLGGLSRQFGTTAARADGKTPVVGIYVGWRGAVVEAPIIEQFTFWNRRQKSQTLPKPPLIDAFVRIMQDAKGPNHDDPNTITVMIGHSFGGAVLETALSEIWQRSVTDAPHQLTSPADLVVLLNEAQEARRSHPLLESLVDTGNTQDHCAPLQKPLIVSISSTGDYATRVFYPFGQALVRPTTHLAHHATPDDFGFKSEVPLFFNTTAHLGALQSHLLDAVPAPNTPSADPTAGIVDPEMKAAVETCGKRAFLVTTLGGVKYVLIAKPKAANTTPYWVMQMPTTIVPDHSTIFTPVFRNFLISLLMAVTLP